MLSARALAPATAGHRTGGRGRRNPVVFAYEQHRQVIDDRPIQRFDEWPAIDRAVAEETRDDFRAAANFEGVCGADGDRHAGRDHAVGAEHADTEIGDMHRAALALVGARRAPEQLGHHAIDVGPFGQRVAVAAMGGGQQILAREIRADAGRDRFLPGRQVQRPAYQRRLGGSGQAPRLDATLAGDLGRVLEGADTRHGAIVREQPGGRIFICVHGRPKFTRGGRRAPHRSTPSADSAIQRQASSAAANFVLEWAAGGVGRNTRNRRGTNRSDCFAREECLMTRDDHVRK